ncbi:heterocyst development glycosyltransferase HepC [Mastigocladopsis repens]|uniref:heterocyst development glycosyltransferase HepC n=1 Tax=Mastigocladopsis repens TaxID=221287 RepID=UPI0002ECAC7D|nr:heterocyst development glycosyltransferase HepC [Mastigocladopsis repens]
MATSLIPTLPNYYTVKQQQQDNPSQYCTLQWRRGQLVVMLPGVVKQPYMPSLDRKQLLVECLNHSPINLVRIDPKLGEAKLKFWADACEQASKPIFLRIPSSNKQPKQTDSALWWFKRFTDWLAALVFLLAVSPIMLGLVLLMSLYYPGSLFSCEWHVGERGKLFKVFKFRTTTLSKKAIGEQAIAHQSNLCQREDEQEITTLGRWMRKYGLENLPQLLNVLRGEMSLTGPKCLSLEDAVRLNIQTQRQLNALPGITSLSQVEEKFQPVESGCGETL